MWWKPPSETSIWHCAEALVSKLCKHKSDGVTVCTAVMAETDSLSLLSLFLSSTIENVSRSLLSVTYPKKWWFKNQFWLLYEASFTESTFLVETEPPVLSFLCACVSQSRPPSVLWEEWRRKPSDHFASVTSNLFACACVCLLCMYRVTEDKCSFSHTWHRGEMCTLWGQKHAHVHAFLTWITHLHKSHRAALNIYLWACADSRPLSLTYTHI